MTAARTGTDTAVTVIEFTGTGRLSDTAVVVMRAVSRAVPMRGRYTRSSRSHHTHTATRLLLLLLLTVTLTRIMTDGRMNDG